MNDARLLVSDSVGEVARLSRRGGRVVVEWVSEDVASDLHGWVRDGLSEMVGEPGRMHPRLTLSNDPQFLERIARRLVGFGFSVRLEDFGPDVGPRAMFAVPPPIGLAAWLKAAREENRRVDALLEKLDGFEGNAGRLNLSKSDGGLAELIAQSKNAGGLAKLIAKAKNDGGLAELIAKATATPRSYHPSKERFITAADVTWRGLPKTFTASDQRPDPDLRSRVS
jgi:hypothetical protein